MSGKNLQHAAATLVRQLQARVQSLIADAASLEVWTYGVAAPHLESVAASEDVAALAAAGGSAVRRQGYTRVVFECDVDACTETGREDTVDAMARPMHGATVAAALAAREALLAEGYQILGKLRG